MLLRTARAARRPLVDRRRLGDRLLWLMGAGFGAQGFRLEEGTSENHCMTARSP